MAILSDHVDNSASTSSDPINDRYEVFLSFRGSDTRHSFTDHLYHHLKRAAILTFRDNDELEKGETLKQQLENAIRESSVSIIVFSKDYASSSWCLDEVVRILEQKKVRGDNYKVLPIFYHVDVADVRHQKGSYKEAFDEHIEKGRVSLEKIKSWQAALHEAANLVGFPLDEERSEEDFISDIVTEVEKSLPDHLDVPAHLFGMNYRANWIGSWFKDRSEDNNVLVICGIGGIGKTTIAKHFFNKHCRDFEGSCFLATINEKWDRSGFDVCDLQSQLLTNILNKETKIYNRYNGTAMIKRAICNKKVLLVLDDVSETKQLEALLGEPQRFPLGSKILVTTRNMSLVKHVIGHPMAHNVTGLNDNDSLKLFCWHAFQQYHPPEAYKKLSEKVVFRCEGLPLALKVLGASLSEHSNTVIWEAKLRKLDEIANRDIHDVMVISYDSLEDDMVKNLFLHVACFFVGKEEDYVVKILDHCGLYATVGIHNLIARCLITIDDEKYLMMHQVIRDMGREIVRKENPDEPGRRSRLWNHEDSLTVLKDDKGTEAVQGLILNGLMINKVESDGSSVAGADANPHLITKVIGYVKKRKEEVLDRFLRSKEGELKIDAFAKMVNLKFVMLNRVHLTGCCNKFPKEMRWITWHGFPQAYVPMELPLEKLVALDLQHSLLKQVWKGYKEVKSLKFLNLSYSLELWQTPDFRGLLQLERLILRGCSNLVKVCKTIGILNGLLSLDLRDCKSLKDLPGLPESIVTLDLSGCHLGGFSSEQQNVEPFGFLYRIVKFSTPSIATEPIKLLACLPHSLVTLSLQDCNLSDESFPRDFSGLSSLENLGLGGNLITRLPDCVTNLSNSRLRRLTVNDCPHLQSVMYPPVTVRDLFILRSRQVRKAKARLISRGLSLVIDESTEYVEVEGCFKLVKAGNVDGKVIKNLGLESVLIGSEAKVLYEFGIFSTYVEGREVPSCFTTYSITSTGDEVMKSISCSYTIPISSPAKKIEGLNICIAQKHITPLSRLDNVTIRVSHKRMGLRWIYSYSHRFHFGKKKILEDSLWISTWKCDDLLEGGDEIEVSFHIFNGTGYEVKKCGIRIVYEDDLEYNIISPTPLLEEEEEEDKDDLRWSDNMDVAFSDYPIPRTTFILHGHGPYHFGPLNLNSNFQEDWDGQAFAKRLITNHRCRNKNSGPLGFEAGDLPSTAVPLGNPTPSACV